MRWERHKYRTLFFVLIALIVLFPLLRSARGTRVLLDAVIALVFLVSIVNVFTTPLLRVAAIVLAVPTLVGVATGYLLPGVPRVELATGLHLLAATYFGFTIGVILRGFRRESGVSADAVYGAFCGYMLLGLAFGHLYCVAELLQPGSFRGDDFGKPSDDGHHFLLTYFSFLTLTTVGYGDITPGSDPARGLAVVEAIAGQFYLAVLVAELIGKRVSQAFSPPAGGGENGGRGE